MSIETELAARGISTTVKLIAAGVALVLFALVVWWVFIRPGQKAEEAATAKVDATLATGTAKAAQDAQRVVIDVTGGAEINTRLTQENRDAILAAPDAGVSAPAAARIARQRLCLRDTYIADAACDQLRQPRP